MAKFEITREKVLDFGNHKYAKDMVVLVTERGNCVAKKGDWEKVSLTYDCWKNNGAFISFIPENAVLTKELKSELYFKQDVFMPFNFRGVSVDGLAYFGDHENVVNLEKKESELMENVMQNVRPLNNLINYDVETMLTYRRKGKMDNFLSIIGEKEDIYITEKLHGTWCCMAYIDGDVVITSKGLSKKGYAFKNDFNDNKNPYLNAYKNNLKQFVSLIDEMKERGIKDFYVLGEVFGKGIQDLEYGLDDVQFRVFEMYEGKFNAGQYSKWTNVKELCDKVGFNTVPLLKTIKAKDFSFEDMIELSKGKDEITGTHIREGIVFRNNSGLPVWNGERFMFKCVSEDYKNRLNEDRTEYS